MAYYYYSEPSEREDTRELTVFCGNDDCTQFEVDVDAELTGTLYNGNFYAIYECPTCGNETEIHKEFSSDDLYDGPDTLEEARGEA